MPSDLDLSERARHAQRLADSVLLREDCLTQIDELVRSAAVRLRADIASLSMLSDRQITVSAHSPGDSSARSPMLNRGAETAFEDTVCANALRSDELLIIPDAHLDPRISSIPAVTDGTVGAYLGSTLHHDGAIVGMLCAVTTQPKTWTADQVEILDAIADQVLTAIVCSTI